MKERSKGNSILIIFRLEGGGTGCTHICPVAFGLVD